MKRQIGRHLTETLLLFGALFFTLPYIPSHEIERLPLFPAAAIAGVLFLGSRLIRWGRLYLVAFPETLGFLGFLWAMNAATNLIYTTS